MYDFSLPRNLVKDKENEFLQKSSMPLLQRSKPDSG